MKKRTAFLFSLAVMATLAAAVPSRGIFEALPSAATKAASLSERGVPLASDISPGEGLSSRKGGPSNLLAQSSPQVKNGSADASPAKVVVPKGNPIVIDGIFSKGEWNPVEDQQAEKQKIARVISSVIGWAKDKNLDLFFSSIAHDEDYISVTPGKRVIKRFEDVKQNIPFWMSPDFKYVRHELKDLEIKFAQCGEVAWFYCVLDDINTYKGEPASWENTRWTGVVEKRDGRWVVVSQHFSFASDK